MCTSYAAPSPRSVSARTTVAPGTALSAAALAFAASDPVSRVSPGPCAIRAGLPGGGCDVDEPDDPPAALATVAAPAATPSASAPVTIQPRALSLNTLCSFLGG